MLHPIWIIPIMYMLECAYQVGSEDVKNAAGYIGEDVTLKLNVDPTWKLTVIEWSIYSNFTDIAKFQDGKINIIRDRMYLNTTSGDLTIKNLKASDELKYTVYLENERRDERTIHVQLFVQDQIKPNITLLHSFLDADKCVISLKCSSLNSNIGLSWKAAHDFTESFCSDRPNITRESVMWAVLPTNKDIKFTCISTDGKHYASSKWRGKCTVGSEDVKNVTGYIGEEVTLKLNVDPTWKLTVIEWSIYDNVTYIARFIYGEINIISDRRNRMSLNTTSGDLTIKNLKASDELKYRVNLENVRGDERTIHVQLFVQVNSSSSRSMFMTSWCITDQFKPNITLLHSFLDADKCAISLKCSSLNSNIGLSWKAAHDFTGSFYSDRPNITRESVMWAALTTNKDVNFTCIATDGKHNASSKWHGKCPAPSPGKTPLSVLKLLSSVVAASPYVLVTIILAVKCYRAQTEPDEEKRMYRVIEAEASV